MNVEQFASELKVEPHLLVKQLQAAGVAVNGTRDVISDDDKARLLDYLRGKHGSAEPKNKITLTRKQTGEKVTADRIGPTRTVQVEVRNKKVFVKREVMSQQGVAAEVPAEKVVEKLDEHAYPKKVTPDKPSRIDDPMPGRGKGSPEIDRLSTSEGFYNDLLDQSSQRNPTMECTLPKVGKTYRGTVKQLFDFGAIVEIMSGHSGLLHISQITDKRVEKVSDHLKVGQAVKVKVLETDEKGRMRLSMKAVTLYDEVEGLMRCATCGSKTALDDSFCGGCGTPLGTAVVIEEDQKLDDRNGSDTKTPLGPGGQRFTTTSQAEHERRISSESGSPGELRGLESDQWLLDSCRSLTKSILSEIIGPWNNGVAAAQKTYEVEHQLLTQTQMSAYADAVSSVSAVEKEVASEKLENETMLKSVSNRFSGMPAELYLLALQNEMRRLQGSGERSQHQPADGKSLSANIKSAVSVCEGIRGIHGTEMQSGIKEIKSYGIPLFFGSWLLFGLWLSSADFGFVIACILTVGIPFFRERSAISKARSASASLVDAIARRHVWLDKVRLKSARDEAQDMREKTDKALATGRLAAASALTGSLETLLKGVEPVALRARETLKRIQSEGRYKTASTTENAAWASWKCATNHAGVVRLGQISISAGALLSSHSKMILGSPIATPFAVPVLASLRNGRSIYVAIKDHSQMAQGYAVARNAIFRLLATAPPAKVLFTFIDPLGQGQNVTSFLALGDFDESLINVQAWTDPRQIERKLADLTEHMETVIQKYLRSDYATIDDYNDAAGEIAEAYRVAVIFDFPECITENAARQLERIVQNGGRCGVYAIVIHDASKNTAYGVNAAAMLKHTITFLEEGGKFYWDNYGQGKHEKSVMLQLDKAPPEELIRRVLKTVGEAAKEALKVEVPYPKLLQLAGIDADQVWNWSTIDGIRIPLGPGSARKPRWLELGVGLSVHALVIGRPGSGKSNMMHVAISTAARMYSPSELQLYLIDFKEGVEFKPYAEARLPHARVIAIRSEREFGLSVLRALDAELKRRSDAFRKLGIQDFRQYRALLDASGQALKLPRILLLIDEFQEFFVKQDAISDEVALLLDRIVRQGRAFGMHMLLGSQTLSGGYSLPRATLNLITVRIALQSSEADSRMILADDNTAARRLSRPGEGIYNASSGLIEGNNLFQVALFDDVDRNSVFDVVAEKLAQARKSDEAWPAELFEAPLIFEGHEPAVLSESAPLLELLSLSKQPEQRRAFDVWLGEPIEIKPPTSFKVSRQAGTHLLVVSKNEEEAVGVLCAAILGLVLQNRPGKIEIPIVDLTTADAAWADLPEHMESLFPSHKIKVYDRRGLPRILQSLSDLIRERIDETGTPETTHFLVLLGMHRARDLRQQDSYPRPSMDDDETPDLSSQLASILRDGPECGIHVLTWCDSVGNLEKVFDRRVMAEFGTRIVGQMSSNDLRTLVEDESAASRLERPHRMVKYEEEHVGVLETFRPYGPPDRKWLEAVALANH